MSYRNMRGKSPFAGLLDYTKVPQPSKSHREREKQRHQRRLLLGAKGKESYAKELFVL